MISVKFCVGLLTFVLCSQLQAVTLKQYEAILQKAESGDIPAATMLDLHAPKISDSEESFRNLMQRAEEGDSFAQFLLAGVYNSGNGLERNKVLATKWFRASHTFSSQLSAGVSYLFGNGVPKDESLGRKLCLAAFALSDGNADNPVVQNSLGCMYYLGLGVEKDFNTALYWCTKSAEQGYYAAQCNLGDMYFYGSGAAKDTSLGIYWYVLAANQGCPSSKHKLGEIYTKEDAIKSNNWYAEALATFKENSELRSGLEQCILGEMYMKGKGCTRDESLGLYWWRKAAEQGCFFPGLAEFSLGDYYFKTGNKDEAVKWYTKSAELGDLEAQYALAEILAEGDKSQADKWYKCALHGFMTKADSGDAFYQYRVADIYLNGKGTGIPKDEAEAVKWYTKAADQGLDLAQYILGNCYLKGKGVAKNEAEAVKWHTKAADQGLALAQDALGDRYFYGEGIGKDEKEAFKWYTKAADQGLVSAQCTLGDMYLEGKTPVTEFEELSNSPMKFTKARKVDIDTNTTSTNDISSQTYDISGFVPDKDVFDIAMEHSTKNEKEAANWYTKAANQGYGRAQYKLGDCYFDGVGVSKDATEGIKWYTKAAEQGNALGQYKLGDCYFNGKGVIRDEEEAVKWYTKAAEKEYHKAQYTLGNCYFYGTGVIKDQEEGVKWYTKAADQEYDVSQCTLGDCYFSGTGVTQDIKEATKWYTKAADHGHAWAQYMVREINTGGAPEMKSATKKAYINPDFKSADKLVIEAMSGSIPAQKAVIEAYMQGEVAMLSRNIPKDTLCKWLKVGAETDMTALLSYMVITARGWTPSKGSPVIPPNTQEFDWSIKQLYNLASMGDPRACYILGMTYYYQPSAIGRASILPLDEAAQKKVNAEKSAQLAIKYLTIATQAKDDTIANPARNLLADIYLDNKAGYLDRTKANMLLESAAYTGDFSALYQAATEYAKEGLKDKATWFALLLKYTLSYKIERLDSFSTKLWQAETADHIIAEKPPTDATKEKAKLAAQAIIAQIQARNNL